MVVMFIPLFLINFIKEYRVVVLPEPVGPVTTIIPKGFLPAVSIICLCSWLRPKSFRVNSALCDVSNRITIFSPLTVGAIEIRISIEPVDS